MKIINKTHYDTHYLRKLFLECEKHSFKIFLKHSNPKHRQVTIIYHRTGWIGGHASLIWPTITLKLPRKYTGYRRHNIPKWAGESSKDITPSLPLPAREVASVYLHELAHNLGIRHKNMPKGGHTKYDTPWCPDESVPIKQKTKNIQPKLNLTELRFKQAQKKLAIWQTKLNRAKTYVKKYQQKVKYYERKQAAFKQ